MRKVEDRRPEQLLTGRRVRAGLCWASSIESKAASEMKPGEDKVEETED